MLLDLITWFCFFGFFFFFFEKEKIFVGIKIVLSHFKF